MTVEKHQLLDLIDDYKAAVTHAVTLLNAKSEKEKGFQISQEKPGYYAGYLDDVKESRYAFHGYGCVVKTPKFEVDFDFADKERSDGIDIWFLYSFLTSNLSVNRKYFLLTSHEQIEQLLRELEAEGVVAKNVEQYSERTYFLIADIQNPSPPTVKLYFADE